MAMDHLFSSHARFALAAFGSLVFLFPASAQELIGVYVLWAEADRAEVEVEGPVLLTVTLQGKPPPGQMGPRQEQLSLITDNVTDLFFVEPLPEKALVFPEKGVYQFVYRLRPKSTSVEFIPSLRLTMKHPLRPRPHTSFADPIPLKVVPARKREAAVPLTVLRAPTSFLELRGTEARGKGWRIVPVLAGTVLVGVPLGCLLALFLWRRRHPDLAAVRQRRRGRAAQAALHQLVGAAEVEGVSDIALNYLRDRLDFPTLEPTSPEVEHFLKRRGAGKAAARRWGLLFHLCGQGRFSPEGGPSPATLAEEARDLIQTLEEETCFRV